MTLYCIVNLEVWVSFVVREYSNLPTSNLVSSALVPGNVVSNALPPLSKHYNDALHN